MIEHYTDTLTTHIVQVIRYGDRIAHACTCMHTCYAKRYTYNSSCLCTLYVYMLHAHAHYAQSPY